MKQARWLIAVVVIVAITAMIFTGTKQRPLTIGDPVPDFRATDLNGNYFFFNDFRSQVVLLNFSATWCTYCLEELPYLDQLKQKFEDQGLVVVTVFQDHQNINVIREIKAKNQVTFPFVTDTEEWVFKLFGVRALPHSVIIDRNSVVRYAYTGFALNDMGKYERQISNLLQEGGE